jgi:hypothetical protein
MRMDPYEVDAVSGDRSSLLLEVMQRLGKVRQGEGLAWVMRSDPTRSFYSITCFFDGLVTSGFRLTLHDSHCHRQPVLLHVKGFSHNVT